MWFFLPLPQGVTLIGYKIYDVKIKTLGTHTAVEQVNTSHLAKHVASQLEKKNPEPFRARFENALKNAFFDFVKYEPKRSNFFQNSNYIVLYEKNAFRFNFLISGRAPTGKSLRAGLPALGKPRPSRLFQLDLRCI